MVTKATEKAGSLCEVRPAPPPGLTIGGQQRVCGVLLREPFDLVDLLLDLQALQVVELGLVALEGAVHVVLALAVRRVLTLQGNPKAAEPQEQPGWMEADMRPG